MIAPIDYDPAVHHLHNLPVAYQLRKDTGDDTVVTYLHRGTGLWIVAMLSQDGKLLMEFDTVDGEDGTGKAPKTREHYQWMVKHLTQLTTKDEQKSKILSWDHEMKRKHCEDQADLKDKCKAMFRYIARCRGQMAAERYEQQTGLDLHSAEPPNRA